MFYTPLDEWFSLLTILYRYVTSMEPNWREFVEYVKPLSCSSSWHLIHLRSSECFHTGVFFNLRLCMSIYWRDFVFVWYIVLVLFDLDIIYNVLYSKCWFIVSIIHHYWIIDRCRWVEEKSMCMYMAVIQYNALCVLFLQILAKRYLLADLIR